ncbi:MAG: protein kinase [Magnetococcus sp. YQC-5]
MTQSLQIGDLSARKYLIRAKLGQDMFGSSYLAQNLTNDTLVILVLIPAAIHENQREFLNYKRNFSLMQLLDHPNLVKAYDLEHDQETGHHFQVLEYVEGANLHTVRRSRKTGLFSLAEAMAVCRQIAAALDFVHQTMHHRDLRPHNILITLDNTVKLTGFDLTSEQLGIKLRTRYFREHPDEALYLQNYLAPEQFFDFMPVGHTVDLYALTVLFYELITGQPPFQAKDSRERIHAICNVIPQAIPSIGQRRNQFLLQGLAKDSGNRFTSAMEFVNAIEGSAGSVLSTQWSANKRGVLIAAGMVWLVVISMPGLIAWLRPLAPVAGFMHATLHPSVETQTVTSVAVSLPEVTRATPPVQNQPVQSTHDRTAQPQAKKNMTPHEVLSLTVESRPPGAVLFLDAKRVGKTPFTMDQAKVGHHTIRMEKEGFIPVEMELELTKNTVVDLGLESLLPSSSLADESPSRPENPLSEPAQRVASVPVTRVTPAREKEQEKTIQQEILSLLSSANRHFKADRLTKPKGENALEAYQKMLQLASQNQEALQGISHIVKRLLVLAQEDLDNWRLLRPPEQNAMEKFRTVLELDANNVQAQAGLEEIVDRLLSLAQRFADQEEKSLDYLHQAEKVLPGSPRITQMAKDLKVR